MLCNEPTKFYIPNIAVPLTDGDIAFMLLTDINCDGEYEKKLFPSFVTEKEGYSARYLSTIFMPLTQTAFMWLKNCLSIMLKIKTEIFLLILNIYPVKNSRIYTEHSKAQNH